MNPDLARYHRLVLFPGLGMLGVLRARGRATSDADRSELTAALRCQMAGLAIWALHGVLQLGVWFVGFLMNTAILDPGLLHAYRLVLVACTVLNVGAWIAEWLVVVAAGLAASRGRPYPLSRRQRAALPDSADVEPPSDWKPLNDG